MYFVAESANFEKTVKKLLKRERNLVEAIYRKVYEVAQNPYHYKPLRAPMQGVRRVHVMGSFVLTYTIDEKSKIIVLQDFAHHDQAYH